LLERGVLLERERALHARVIRANDARELVGVELLDPEITAGSIAAYDNGAATPRMVLADASVTGVAGVLVHGDALWICSVDAQFRHPTEIKSFGSMARRARPIRSARCSSATT